MKSVILSFVVFSVLSTPTYAQQRSVQQTQDSAARHFVVFNRPGPQWSRLREFMNEARAHQQLYRDMAARGDIIVGGRMEGEPVLGMSVFRTGIDQTVVRRLLEADPLIRAGVVSLEFREWNIQMGELPSAGSPRAQ